MDSKPISLVSVNTKKKIQNNGWNTWKKYKKKFNNNFIFLEQSNKFNQKLKDIIVINKKELEKTIEENKEKFGLFKTSFVKNNIWKIKNDDELLGIILGYGKNNSEKFYLSRIKNNKEIKLHLFIDKTDYIKLVLKEFGLFRKNIHFMTLPCFMVDLNTDETKMLKKKYEKARQDIIFHYKNKDFLEGTFELLL